MAKPIELALSRIWNHKAIEALSAVELGAYVSLARAIILHSHDPLPTDLDTLQRLARTTRRQWETGKIRITEALNATLSILKTDYAERQAARVARRAVAITARDAAAAKRLQRNNALQASPATLAPAHDTPDMGLMQPYMAAAFLPQKYDRQARNAAVSSTSGPQSLAD